MTGAVADEAFWSRVDKTAFGGCWVWTGQTRNGYGVWRGTGAHRVALASRTPDPGPQRLARLRAKRQRSRGLSTYYYACHHCDNPPCVNPDHLYWGSPMRNAADRDARMPQCEVQSVLYDRQCAARASRTMDGVGMCGVHYWRAEKKRTTDAAVTAWAKGRQG